MPKLIWSANLGEYVVDLKESPDGSQWAAAAAATGQIAIFDAATGEQKHALKGHALGAHVVAYSPDGKVLASGGQDGQIKFWSPSSGEELGRCPGGAPWVTQLAWHPVPNPKTGFYELVSIAGKKLRLWDANGAQVRAFEDSVATVSDIAWLPPFDKRELVSVCSGNALVLDAENGVVSGRRKLPNGVLVLSCSPDGKWMMTGHQDNSIHVWNLRGSTEAHMRGYESKVTRLSWDSSGRYLATNGGAEVAVWDCSGKGPEGTAPLMLAWHERTVRDQAFQHSGSSLASVDEGGFFAVWRTQVSGRPPAPLFHGKLGSGGTVLRWSADDKILVIGTESGWIRAIEII